jgi:serine/threonine protein kinase
LKKFRFSKGSSTKISHKGFSDLSHPHLVTLLGGWIREDELFLIFPTPVLTLKDLLLSRRSIYRTEEGIDSVLRQLDGIADAINYLSQLQDRRKGFHHGIRPDNIYLFPVEHEKDLYTWKLGSFGTDFEMFNFSEKTKTNIEASWSRKYTAPESHHDAEHQLVQASEKLDGWSLGCVLVEVLYWLIENVDQKTLTHYEMWKPGEPFWKRYPGGTIVLQPSVTQFLGMIWASDYLPNSMKKVAHLASACLVVDQKARRWLDLAGIGLKSRFDTARSVISQAAEPESEVKDKRLSSNHPPAPSRTPTPQTDLPSEENTDIVDVDGLKKFLKPFESRTKGQRWGLQKVLSSRGSGTGGAPSAASNVKPLADEYPASASSSSSSANMRTDDPALLRAMNFSSSYIQTNVIDCWAIAELGLGVEHYIAHGYQQLQNANAVDEAAQRPSAEQEESSTLRPKSPVLPNRTLATGGTISLASDQSLDHDAGKMAAGLAPNEGTEKPNTEDAVQANDRAEKRTAFLGGLMHWRDLSSEEQKACMGPRATLNLNDGICYEPDELLKEFWETYLYPRLRILASGYRDIFGRRIRRDYTIQLVVMQQETSQQLRPTIVITSTSKKLSRRLARKFTIDLLYIEEMWILTGSFDIVANANIVQIT